MKQIILNADDYGPSKFFNKGIIEGIKKGVVNSVSVFVTFGQENLDNIKKLKELVDRNGYDVKIGLHFTTTAGSPVSSSEIVPSLCFKSKTGKWLFKDPTTIKLKYYLSTQLGAELEAQLQLLAQTLGLASISEIDHINNHVGLVHFVDKLWDSYVEVAVKYGIPVRSPIPYHKVPGSIILTNKMLKNRKIKKPLPATMDAIKRAGRSVFVEGNIKTVIKLAKETKYRELKEKWSSATEKDVKIPSHFVMHYYKQPSERKIQHFLNQLAIREPNTEETGELMLHLGLGKYSGEKRLWGVDKKSYFGRTKELRSLINSDIIKHLKDNNIKLVNYSTM